MQMANVPDCNVLAFPLEAGQGFNSDARMH